MLLQCGWRPCFSICKLSNAAEWSCFFIIPLNKMSNAAPEKAPETNDSFFWPIYIYNYI